MWIWVCGPLATGSASAAERQLNLAALNAAALHLFQMGHVPLIGANMALPLSAAAGLDETSYEIRLPLSLALLERCDACLRIGGPSRGSDQEVARFVAAGKPVFHALAEVPAAAQALR